MTTKLDYVSGASILPPNSFGISPSNLIKFFDKPHEWYRTQVLGEQDPFTGSTATVLGTCVHFIAEEYTKTRSVDKSEIYKYLYKMCVLGIDKQPDFSNEDESIEFLETYANNPEIDARHILSKYKEMGNALIKYLQQDVPFESESLVSAEVTPGFHVSGSCDALVGSKQATTIVDYKTTSGTPKDSIPYNYKLQLLSYAYIYRSMGYNVDRLRIVWITQPDTNRYSEKTGKRLKDYPCQIVPVTYVITEEDWNFISSILSLVAESVAYVQQHPETAYLIFKDYRLK